MPLPCIILGLDNTGVLNKAQDNRHRPSTKGFDLLQDIKHRLSELAFEITWIWVPGHQTITSESPIEAVMNDACDTRAKTLAQWLCDSYVRPKPMNFSRGFSLWLGDTKCSSITVDNLYDWTMDQTSMSSRAYWIKKSKLTTLQVRLVDWEILYQAIGQLDSTSTSSLQVGFVPRAKGKFGEAMNRTLCAGNVASWKKPHPIFSNAMDVILIVSGITALMHFANGCALMTRIPKSRRN